MNRKNLQNPWTSAPKFWNPNYRNTHKPDHLSPEYPLSPGPGIITEASSLLLSSTGEVAEWVGNSLGVFDRDGSHGGRPRWRQRDTAGRGNYLYFSQKYNDWNIGAVINSGAVKLQNKQNSDLPPTSGNILPTCSTTQ